MPLFLFISEFNLEDCLDYLVSPLLVIQLDC